MLENSFFVLFRSLYWYGDIKNACFRLGLNKYFAFFIWYLVIISLIYLLSSDFEVFCLFFIFSRIFSKSRIFSRGISFLLDLFVVVRIFDILRRIFFGFAVVGDIFVGIMFILFFFWRFLVVKDVSFFRVFLILYLIFLFIRCGVGLTWLCFKFLSGTMFIYFRLSSFVG